MLAVIFRATTAAVDDRYAALAEQLRQLAMQEYGCREFFALCEGDQEIALSYWDNEEQIRAWKQAAEHRLAQAMGRSTWYADYRIQVVQILREYSKQPSR